MTALAGRPRPRVIIVGGGITGLAAAYQVVLERPDCELSVIEPRERLGGNIVTCHRDGFLLDGGPDCFLRSKPAAAELCEQLGLGGELISPLATSERVSIAHRGKLIEMPAGMALAVPTRLRPLLSTPLLSLLGKLRILGDLLIEKNHVAPDDETVAEFLLRHFGHEATFHLAGPLLGGIFAGDIEELSMRATFPQLVQLEEQEGSLIRALFSAERARAARSENGFSRRSDDPLDPLEFLRLLRWLRREGQNSAPSPFLSLKSGLGALVSALEQRLPPGVVRLNREVTCVSFAQEQFTVSLDGGETLSADAVLLCCPAHAASRLLSALPDSRLTDTLAQIPYVSTATVFFGFEKTPSVPLRSAGFIVPRDEGRMLASTYVSSKFSGRAPEGQALLRVFLGGARDPGLVEASADAELATLARDELGRYLGTVVAEASFVQVFRWLRSNPQPTRGQMERLRRLEEAARALPRLALAGSAYGVGISDCIRQGRARASQVLSSFR